MNDTELIKDSVETILEANKRKSDCRVTELEELLIAFLAKAVELSRLEIYENDPGHWSGSSVRRVLEHSQDQLRQLQDSALVEAEIYELSMQGLDIFESMID